MYLQIDKPDTLQNEKVHITASNLKPNALYKMVMFLKHNYGSHNAFAVFKSDAAGRIDLATTKPIRGTYNDVDAMGLFLSQKPTDEFQFGGYLRCTPPIPFVYQLMLLDNSGNLLETLPIKKHWMHPNLTRIELDSEGFCGTLFKPPGEGPFPCVLDISGTGGGLHEHKGSMLASEGFVVLCLAFFQFKHLPKNIEDVSLEYFKVAIDWLVSQSFTQNVIGIQGVSFGATIVDILSTRYPEIKAVVSINGPILPNRYVPIQEKGKPLPLADIDDSVIRFINGVMCSDKVWASVKPTEEVRIPFERAEKDVAYRFVASMDDLVNNSIYCAQQKSVAVRESGHGSVEVDLVNGGHIMEPPYFPHHDIVYAKFQGFYCAYGGEVVLHGKSQEDSWQRTIDFFKKYLGAPPKMPEWERQTVIFNKHSKL